MPFPSPSPFSAPPSPSPAVANAEFLLSLSAPPDRAGPRLAPSEAELLIDPAFYSFLSGVTVVLLLFSFSYIIAYATLSTVRQRQYRKYRQKRRRQEEREQLARGAAGSPRPAPFLYPAPLPLLPSPAFVGSLRPLSSSSSSFSLPLYHSSPSFLSSRRSLPALFRPVASVLAAASSASPAQLPRLSLAFSSPQALSDYVRALLTPQARTPAAVPLPTPAFTTPPHTVNGAHRPTQSTTSLPTPAQRGMEYGRRASIAVATVADAGVFSTEPVPLSATQQDELDAAQDEHNRGFLSFSLSTFLLTVALLWLALLSLTLTYSTPRLTSHWLLAWLTAELVSSLWTLVSILTSLSLFLVAPFAYLYYEAEGLVFIPLPTFLTSTRLSVEEDESYRTFLPRFVETVVVLCCFSVMLYGSFHLLHCMVYHLPLLQLQWPRWSVLHSLWSLTQLNLAASLAALFTPALLSNVTHFVPGLLICLLRSHSGFSSLLSAAFSLRVPFYYNHHLQRQRDLLEVKLTHARLLLASASTHARRMLLARRVQSLESHAKVVDAELHPPLLSLSSFPVLRNGVWFGLSVLCLLLVWHTMVRVMQREARLMMSSIDDLLSADDGDGGQARGVVAFLLTLIVSALRFLLRSMKHAINGLLFTLGMIRRRDMEARSAMTSSVLLSSFPLSATSLSWLLEVWSDVLRLVSSFLLGQNGFRQPVSSLLFDGMVASFFCLSCTIGLYRMQLMKPYSPFSSFASTANAAFARSEEEEAAAAVRAADGDHLTELHQPNPSPHLHSSALPPATVAGASGPTSALHSAQFFVVNTTVLLLLACSLPFSLWLLGLSSFDLPHFYPSARELSTGLFIHLYNLAFIVLSARQGAALWLRILWFLIKTSYSSLHALLTWLLPSLQPSLPSPATLAALPATVRAHPRVAQMSFLLSWQGLYWAARAAAVPVLQLLWVLLLYLLRVLVVALRLCAKNLYGQLLRSIQQQLREHSAQPLVQRGQEEESGEQGQLERAVSRLRGMDEERSAAAPAQLKAEAAAFLALRGEEEEEKSRESSSHGSNLHSPPVPSTCASPLLPRAFSPTRPPSSSPTSHIVHLLAPRPLHLAASISLDSLNTDQPSHSPELPRRSASQASSQPTLHHHSSHDLPTPPFHLSHSSILALDSPTTGEPPSSASASTSPPSPSSSSALLVPPAPDLDGGSPLLVRRRKRRFTEQRG